MEKPAPNDHPIIDPIRNRWSPRAYDGKALDPKELASLFEAARWAPSAFNEQPWRWIVASCDDAAAFSAMLDCLDPWNQKWAGSAGALTIAVASEQFARNGKPNAWAGYDLGQACAQLAVQATSMALYVHPMAGLDPEKARERYAIPEGFSAITALAIGRGGDPESLPEEMREGELAPRERKALSELVFGGRWGETFPLDR